MKKSKSHGSQGLLNKILFLAGFILATTGIFAQNRYQPLGNGIDRIHFLQEVGDTLYGFVFTQTTWQICLRDGDLWRASKPIKLNGDKPIMVEHLNGFLYALTNARLLKWNGGDWELVAASDFSRMARYRNRLILRGPSYMVNNTLTNSIFYHDGITTDTLRTLGGQSVYITGSVTQMRVIDGKLFICGQLFNTNQGNVSGHLIAWNDTSFSSPMIPIVNLPALSEVVKYNGNLYVAGYQFPYRRTNVYKVIGQTPVPIDSAEVGLNIPFGSVVNNLVVQGNRLYGVFYYSGSRKLVYYNGFEWKNSGDALVNSGINLPSLAYDLPWRSLLTSGNKLYSNQTTDNLSPNCAVWVRDSAFFAINLAVIDQRNPSCTQYLANRFLNVKVDVNAGADVFLTSKAGTVTVELPKNQTTVLKVPANELPYFEPKSCSDSILTFLPGNNALAKGEFFYEPIGSIADVSCSIIGQTGWRCRQGFHEDFFITVGNVGTDSLSNILLTFSYPQQSTFVNSSAPIQSTAPGNTTFAIAKLSAGNQMIIRVRLLNTTALTLSDTVHFICNVAIPTADANLLNNTSVLPQLVVAAYDPNNKLVSKEKVNPWGGTLGYQINFQNLGSDTAWRVVVVDSLPVGVKPNTFHFIGASHEVVYTLQNGILHFFFDAINLADSASSAEASKGYVQFSVEMEEQLSIKDSIKNKAFIYFDFQPAVITNVALTTHMENIGVEEAAILDFAVYPNPSSGLVIIATSTTQRLAIYNQLGQAVWSDTITTNHETILNLEHLPSGIYYMVSDSGYAEKIAIQR